jgi:type I restriction enzyme, R subunit
LRISRSAAKSRCACEWGGWGRLSDDGPGQNNPDPSEGPWGGGRAIHQAVQDRVLDPAQYGIIELTTRCTKGGRKPDVGWCMPGAGLSQQHSGKALPESQPSSRAGENPPHGMRGGIEETSASFEARSAPRSYPTTVTHSSCSDPNISQKVKVVVEHFREAVAPLLNGRAKAMVVVGSRKEVVRWKLAIDKYIQQEGYSIGTLVAFSGEVTDHESGEEPFKESSKILNPGLKGRDVRTAFDTGDHQILLVANKFQTGFDQPLLCGMYVDKRLAGIQAVQTLSRLNRAYPGKETTYILDFVNDPEDVLAAFRTYYDTAELAGVTDPNLIFDLRAALDGSGHYDDNEVERVVKAELDPKATQAQLVAALEPVADRLLKQYKAAKQAHIDAVAVHSAKAERDAQDTLNVLILFKRNLGTVVRIYTFLCQIFDYGNTAIEKRAIFYRRLLPLLDFAREHDGIDLSKLQLTHHALKNLGRRMLPLNTEEAEKLQPPTETGSGEVQEKEKVLLAEIIEKVNSLFDGDLTDDDKLVYVNNVIKTKLMESGVLAEQATNNTKEQFANSPDLANALLDAIMDAYAAHTTMSKQALDSKKVQEGLKEILLGPAQLYEALRAKASADPDPPL